MINCVYMSSRAATPASCTWAGLEFVEADHELEMRLRNDRTMLAPVSCAGSSLEKAL
jgi:hypothetical protein